MTNTKYNDFIFRGVSEPDPDPPGDPGEGGDGGSGTGTGGDKEPPP